MKIKEKKSFIILFVSVSLIIVLALLSYVVVNIVSNDYQRYYSDGKLAGYDEGFSEGKQEGYSSRNSEVSQLKVKVKNLENDYDLIYDEYRFYHKCAVIVTTAGEKYHHYGCPHILNRSFYIYNIENAEAYGYAECLDCAITSFTGTLSEYAAKINGY